MKKHFPVILAGVSVLMSLVLLIQVFRLENTVKHNQEQLTQELAQFRNPLYNILNSIADQTGYTLSAAEDAVKSVDRFALHPSGLDADTRILRSGISIVLDEWSSDTTAELDVSLDDSHFSIPLTVENGVCTGEMEFPTKQIEDLRMELRYTRSGVHYREEVGSWNDLAALLPVQHSYSAASELTHQDDVYTVEHIEFSPISYDLTVPDVTETEFRFYQNDSELILTVPITPTRSGGDNIFGALTYVCGPRTIPLTYWHSLNVTFCCRDEYGLHYEFPLYRWYAGPHGEIFSDSLNNHPVELSWD